jgi:DNA primase
MSDTVSTIKDRLSIVDVVGAYVELKKAGVNYKGRCPFHHEKTPSFFVSSERGTFHCFGCGKGGDIFTFTEEIEGLDFKGALKVLAERAGVPLVAEHPEKKERRDRIYELIEDATVRYQRNLVEHADARAYLFKRGVKPETLKEFRIGFANDAWGDMTTYLRAKGYTDAEIEDSGLGKYGERKERGIYDRFRSRIMFPIADGAGRIVGFSGRIFGDSEPEAAKYINSPETEIYKKSQILFGFDKAKRAIRSEGSTILVEGQMDLVLSHQAGLASTVALSGTALSSEHVTMISRLAPALVLALDGDTAGVAAAERSARIALAAGMAVHMACPPDGKDPADMVLADAALWERTVRDAPHVVEQLIRLLGAGNTDMLSFRTEVSRRVIPLVALIPDAIERDHFALRVGEHIGVSVDAVREEMEKAHVPVASDALAQLSRQTPVSGGAMRAFRERKLAGLLYWQEKKEHPSVDVGETIARIKEMLGEGETLFLDEYGQDVKDTLAFEAEYDAEARGVDPVSEVHHQLLLWKRDMIREKARRLTETIRMRQSAGEDTTDVSVEHMTTLRALSEIEESIASG